MNEKYVDVQKVNVIEINNQLAMDMIEKHHYTHKKTPSTISYGIYYPKEGTKFIKNGYKLIGVIVYGPPVGRQVIGSISTELKKYEVLELKRVFIYDGYGKNIESYTISQSLKMLKKDLPHVKVIISYSDPEAGHLGVIYQSLNFLYQGNNTRLFDAFWFRFNNKKEWMHPRTVIATYGTTYFNKLIEKFPNGFEIKELKRKHRYILFLCNKKEKRKLIKNLKHKILPYPKEKNINNEKIIKITKEFINGKQRVDFQSK